MNTVNHGNPNPDHTPDRSPLTRVLVVDNDIKQVQTLLSLLKKEGFEAKGCRKGIAELIVR